MKERRERTVDPKNDLSLSPGRLSPLMFQSEMQIASGSSMHGQNMSPRKGLRHSYDLK